MVPRAGWRIGLLLVVSLWCAAPGGAAEENVPPFTGTTLTGDTFDLAAYLGKVPILIDFGSIYCSSCITSLPHMINLQNKYGAEKLRVVAVNLDAYGLSRVRRFFGQFKGQLSFPVLVDQGLTISRSFEVTTLPTYLLIGGDGNVAARFIGYDDNKRKEIDEAVREVVEEGAITAGAVAAAQEDVVLLSPDNFTKTFQDGISVVGLTGGRTGTFTLRLNGGSERQALSYGKMFWVRTPLSLGSNYIEVLYQDRGVQSSQAVVVFREPKMGEGLQVAFPEFQFHSPDHEKRCDPCHVMEAEGAGEMEVMTTFCLRCHDYLTSFSYVHGPITVGGCSPCHDFTSKPHKYDLLTSGQDLCFSCHEGVRDAFAKAYLHGPVAMGMCTICHSPHSSPFKFQVRASQGDLCLSCHENMKAKAGMFVQHKPFAEGRCSGCHEPHAADIPTYFLKGEGEELCSLCHDEASMATHKHPVGRAPKFVVPGMQLGPDGVLECRTCHDPHASDSDRMSPVAGGCAGCHKM